MFIGILLCVEYGYAFPVRPHPDIVIFVTIQADNYITANAVGISFLMRKPFDLFGVRVKAIQPAAIGSQPHIAICPLTYAKQFVMAKAIGQIAVPEMREFVESFTV
jgi:hypothetical protein